MRALERQRRRVQHTLALGGGPPALASMGAVVVGGSGDPLADMLNNRVLMTAFWAWFLAQFGKVGRRDSPGRLAGRNTRGASPQHNTCAWALLPWRRRSSPSGSRRACGTSAPSWSPGACLPRTHPSARCVRGDPAWLQLSALSALFHRDGQKPHGKSGAGVLIALMARIHQGGLVRCHTVAWRGVAWRVCPQGVTTAIALSQGLGSPVFAVALSFSVIVMYDAMGVRRHAGKHAEVLNQVRCVVCALWGLWNWGGACGGTPASMQRCSTR